MYTVGEFVCYPMHGVCTVTGMEEREVLGVRSMYYTLLPQGAHISMSVPVDRADSVGIRYLSSAEICTRVLEYLHDGEVQPESANWNHRYRENVDKLRNGDIFLVADVVKSLKKRDGEKGLSSGEKKIQQTARQVLSEELCMVLPEAEDVLTSFFGE